MRSSSWLEALFVFAGVCAAQISISPAHPETIQAAVMAAFRTGQVKITIPPGNYRVNPPANGPHLLFQDLSNFTIDAANVQLIFTDRTRGGIEFRDCRNLTLLGPSIRYETAPFTQGVIEAVSPAGDWYDVRIDRGYPTDFDDPKYFPAAPFGSLFDPVTRKFRGGVFDLSEKSVERRGPDLFRLHRAKPSGPGIQPVARGDVVAFRGGGPHNISVLNSTGVHLDGVTVFNAPAFAVVEAGGDGKNRYRVTVKPGPKPAGASTDPLFSSTADAFHSVDVRRGPVLEDCHFESMDDDGIAIHGTYSLVLQAGGKRLIVSRGSFRTGDPVRLFDTGDRLAGEAKVTAVRPLEHFENKNKSHRDARSGNAAGPYFELTLDRAVRAGFDYLASNPAANGSGYVLRNNTISNHRARGMILKADNGSIEGNTVDGSTVGGIVLTPEFWWNEADYSRDVIIRNNTIRNVAVAPDSLGAMVLAALDKAPVPGCGHRRITIEGNRFENIDGVNLLITSACGVDVHDNLFVNPQRRAPVEAGGAWWGEDPASIIFIKNSEEVRLKGNHASGTGPFNKAFTRIAP